VNHQAPSVARGFFSRLLERDGSSLNQMRIPKSVVF
jgi:hypothetical protein